MSRFPHFGQWCAVAVLMALLATSCRHHTRCSHGDDAHYAQVDSLLKGIGDVDSLAAMASRYHDNNDPIGEILALKYQGRVLRQQARFDDAIEVHKRELDVASAVCDTLEMISALSGIGADYRRMGELSNANGLYYKSLLLSDAYSDHESHEAVRARVKALSCIGDIELELRHFATADSIMHEALRGERSLNNYSGIAFNCLNLSGVKRAQGDIDSAWFYCRESLKYNQLAEDKGGIAMCHLRSGELHADERRYAHAQVELQQAYEILKEQDKGFYFVETCLSLAGMHVMQGELGEAWRYAREAESKAQSINSKDLKADVYYLFYELLLMEGDPQQALDYYVKSDQLYDSILGYEKNEEMRNQLLEYEANVKQGEMTSLNNDITRQKHLRNIMATFIVLLIVMAGAIIASLLYAARVRSRTQRLMRQVEETRSLFFTNVVHQLRTPLTAIMGAADDIVVQAASQGNGTASRQRKNAEVIERQGNLLLLLMDRILEVGGVRSALKQPDWRTGDVVGYLRMIVESYRESCVNRQIELTYAPYEKEAQVDLVPRYLNTIVGNLIENAISYSNDYCKINVTSHVEGDQLIIKVSDNGIGIGADDQPHVFEPFYRAAPAEQLCEGVGIGLTVVRDMATVMGGSVAMESKLGEGSVFTVTLPCRYRQEEPLQQLEMVVKPVSDVVRKLPWRAEEGDNHQPNEDRPAVLIVEDHADVARLIGTVLGSDFSVHYASNGEQGLAQAAELMPDLIITDVKMPYMDGLEMCRRVRESRQLRHIPVIVLSARTSGKDRIRGIEAGADAYMVKPFNEDELKMQAIKLLENRRMLKEVYSDTLSKEKPVQTLETATVMGEDELLAAFAGVVDKMTLRGVARLDIGEIAVQLKMGESQLRRRILELTGKSASSYILQLRLEKAMRLLCEHPTMLIGDVAEQCGFSDVAYFSRVFRQHYKMTPTQARNTQ